MTLEELYEQIDGDFAEAVSRLRMEKLINKFIVKFLDDTTCKDLIEAWDAGDEAAAFHAAHSAKGVTMNLSLSKLAALTDIITEALRPGNDELRNSVDVGAKVDELRVAYADTVEKITAYAESAQ